jgi:multicomponent Na+:H+ antiporter subunit D
LSYFLFFVLIPLACAFIIGLFARRMNNISCFLANLSALILTLLSVFLIKSTFVFKVLTLKAGGWSSPLSIYLVADSLTSFMLFTVNFVALFVSLYAINYMNNYTDKWKFNALFMLMLTGLNGVILSGDIFNLYIFLEVASIAGYALVAFGTEAESLEAAFKYAVMGSLASIFILLGIGLLYSYTSTLNMADIAQVLSGRPNSRLVGFVSVLFLAGFGLKSALVPFHSWLPDAHSSAPTPVSAALSGVFIKTLGIYCLARIFFNVLGASVNVHSILVALGVSSMVIGAFLAVAQDDIKRMLAYSSISQVGYIVFAFGIGTPLAILGGLLHLFNHAIFKSLLFLNAGSIEYSTGTRSLSKLGGLNTKLPVTGWTSFLGSMSIAGLPPFGGFWSKLVIIIAAVQAGYIGTSAVAVLVSIVTLIYYLKFQTNVFFGKIRAEFLNIKEPPVKMRLAMIVLAAVCVITGLLLTPGLRPYLAQSAQVISQGELYKYGVLGATK